MEDPHRDDELEVYRANEREQWVLGAVLTVQVIHHETQKSFLHH